MYTDIDLRQLYMKDHVIVNVTHKCHVAGTLKFYYPNHPDTIWYVTCYGEDFDHSADVSFTSSEIVKIKSNHIYLYEEELI